MENAVQKPEPTLLKTPLWDLHRSLGAKMVPFAGYDMPVQYDSMGVLKEHLHTRSKAGLFDVSHMGQAIFSCQNGDPAALLEKIVPGDIRGLEEGEMRYTLLLNAAGGIIDDLIVTRWDHETLLLVVNADCKEKDFAYIQEQLGNDATLDYQAARALIALQGPKAAIALAHFFPFAPTMSFMTSFKRKYEGHDVYISRSGYTGEDGFEVSLPAAMAEKFTRTLLEQSDVKMIGLGARDSLRLEAGLCLYGQDLNETITPIEAHLKWTIAKRRREERNFAGANKIMAQMEDGVARRRVGLQPEGKAPIRTGTELVDTDGQKIGLVTSGGFGPSHDAPVAMGYVDTGFTKIGTQVNAMVRGTARPCTVASLPFVPHNYKRP